MATVARSMDQVLSERGAKASLATSSHSDSIVPAFRSCTNWHYVSTRSSERGDGTHLLYLLEDGFPS